MGHGPATFKQTDATRALKAVSKAGVEVARIEFAKDGSIIIFPGKQVQADKHEPNEWD